MLEIERLRGAAWTLDRQAGNVEYAVRRLRGRVDQTIRGGRWKGPSADRHWRGMEDRCGRLNDAAGRMRNLANRLRSHANQLEAEARRKKALASGSAA